MFAFSVSPFQLRSKTIRIKCLSQVRRQSTLLTELTQIHDSRKKKSPVVRQLQIALACRHWTLLKSSSRLHTNWVFELFELLTFEIYAICVNLFNLLIALFSYFICSQLYRSSSFNSSGRSSNCDTTEDMYSDVSLEDVQDLNHKVSLATQATHFVIFTSGCAMGLLHFRFSNFHCYWCFAKEELVRRKHESWFCNGSLICHWVCEMWTKKNRPRKRNTRTIWAAAQNA